MYVKEIVNNDILNLVDVSRLMYKGVIPEREAKVQFVAVAL
jgi:hypothetical protein